MGYIFTVTITTISTKEILTTSTVVVTNTTMTSTADGDTMFPDLEDARDNLGTVSAWVNFKNIFIKFRNLLISWSKSSSDQLGSREVDSCEEEFIPRM